MKKVSPSPLRDEVNKYHQQNIKKQSLSPCDLVGGTCYNMHKQSYSEKPSLNETGKSMMTIETAKKNQERNIVEEYRQKIQMKLN